MLHNFHVPAGNISEINSSYMPYIERVIRSGNLIGGKEVSGLEKDLSDFLNVEHVLTVASGMDALIISLVALDLPKDSPVLVADNAGGYASLAVLSAGLRPVFCDVSKRDFLIHIENLMVCTVKVQAAIVTHLYGQMAEMQSIVQWAEENEVIVIEDCAQSFGAIQQGKRAGTIGKLGSFSFYPTKNFGGIGDGGAIATNDNLLSMRVKSLRQYGWLERYNIAFKNARNSRLDGINAAVLRKKLKNVDSENNRRRAILNRYINASGQKSFFPYSFAREDNVAHLAVGISTNREEMIQFFADRGVELSVHYPVRDSDQTGLNYLGVDQETPNSKELCQSVVSLPIYPWLSEPQVDLVSKTLTEWSKNELS